MIWKQRGDIWIGPFSMEESSPVPGAGKGHTEEMDCKALCLESEIGCDGSRWERVRNRSHTEKAFVYQSNQFGLYLENISYLEIFFNEGK